jgi:SagB-type dehydrogenase family enzyme
MSGSYRLSPYCVIHPSPDAQSFALVHSLYGSRFELSVELLGALARLARGATLREAAREGPAELAGALETLVEEKVLVDEAELLRLGGPQTFRNRLDPIALAVQRGFNEGGYFPAALEGEPPALLKEPCGAEEIPLALHHDFGGERDAVACLLERRSRRFFAAEPLTRRSFEQLLQLAVRIQSVEQVPGLGSVARRSYPSGGGRHPLEIYPLVRAVESLAPGFYHYDAHRHALRPLGDPGAPRNALFGIAKHNMDAPIASRGDPAVLLVVTAVVGRTCWKYRGIPYQLILQEVGALHQTLSLVATRLGLAGCPIGAFPELAVAELLGLDSRDEAQVGLFALGLPELSAPAAAPATPART